MLVMDILLVLAFVFIFFFFFFNDTATTEIYTLSLHDALPISARALLLWRSRLRQPCSSRLQTTATRSEEHTSELQSRLHLVCRLLLEKKKNTSARAYLIHKLHSPASAVPLTFDGIPLTCGELI